MNKINLFCSLGQKFTQRYCNVFGKKCDLVFSSHQLYVIRSTPSELSKIKYWKPAFLVNPIKIYDKNALVPKVSKVPKVPKVSKVQNFFHGPPIKFILNLLSSALYLYALIICIYGLCAILYTFIGTI